MVARSVSIGPHRLRWILRARPRGGRIRHTHQQDPELVATETDRRVRQRTAACNRAPTSWIT
jgi:hypothetical protein